MDADKNLQTYRQSCRVCLQKGDVNIWDFRVKMQGDPDFPDFVEDNYSINSKEERFMYISDLMAVFAGTTDILELADEFPQLCSKCLDELRKSFYFYEKARNTSIRLRQLYDTFNNERLQANINATTGLDETDQLKPVETDNSDYEFVLSESICDIAKTSSSDNHQLDENTEANNLNRCALDKNASIVVTQYVSASIEPPSKIACLRNAYDDGEFQPPQNLLTIDCKPVEVNDVGQLESLETSADIGLDHNQANAIAPVFICQYCPQAFAKSEFLKTHVQKNHICKICLRTFCHYIDLCRHLREHTDYSCVICKKILSSQSSLRHHIKTVHHINLPPKMALLDFIQRKGDEE